MPHIVSVSSPSIPWRRGERIVVRNGNGKPVEFLHVRNVKPVFNEETEKNPETGEVRSKLSAQIVSFDVDTKGDDR